VQLVASVSGDFPPTPRLSNYAAAQAIPAGSDFTLNWNAFTGADASSVLTIEIMDDMGEVVFQAPDECEEIELAPDASSIVVPGGTLAAGKAYSLRISFFRIAGMAEDVGSGIRLLMGVGSSTELTIRTASGPGVTDLRITDFGLGDTGRFQAAVSGTVGVLVAFEWSEDLVGWTELVRGVIPAGGVLAVEDPGLPAPNGRRMYRAREL
jgi:hypothetical protein